MNTHADKTQENKSPSKAIGSVENVVSQLHNSGERALQFIDNRPEVITQRKLQLLANNNPQAKRVAQFQAMANSHATQQSQPIQKKENNTGLPDNLKTGVENLSGISLDGVKVHRNSDKPAQLNAHAYAQGTDIHVAPGQEKHLPHETWHVVQQAQGRVKPTMQMKQGIPVNDDAGLEHEADVMGARALQMKNDDNLANTTGANAQRKLNEVVQSKSIVVQRYEISGAEGQHPEGSVTASKSEIFRWLNGENMWSQVNTEWCLVGGSAHVEIVEHLLSSNFDGVVTALVAAMGIVPRTDTETKQEYIDFFVHEVMTTEDLDIAVSNRDVADEFPANQAEAKRLLCPEYSKQGVDLLIDATAERFKLPNGVWVIAPESLTGKPKGGRAGLLAAIGAKKSNNEQLDGKGRKRTARNELMKSVLEQELFEKP